MNICSMTNNYAVKLNRIFFPKHGFYSILFYKVLSHPPQYSFIFPYTVFCFTTSFLSLHSVPTLGRRVTTMTRPSAHSGTLTEPRTSATRPRLMKTPRMHSYASCRMRSRTYETNCKVNKHTVLLTNSW